LVQSNLVARLEGVVRPGIDGLELGAIWLGNNRAEVNAGSVGGRWVGTVSMRGNYEVSGSINIREINGDACTCVRTQVPVIRIHIMTHRKITTATARIPESRRMNNNLCDYEQ